MTNDYLRYYDLENYLFEDLNKKFNRDKKLDAFDLLSIIIWKANRAKSRLANRLIEHVENSLQAESKSAGPHLTQKSMNRSEALEAAAEKLTSAIYTATSHQERLEIVMFEWGLYLPMASSILSVLYPKEFTVYDYRVCDELEKDHRGDFCKIGDAKKEFIWPEYCRYRTAVHGAAGDYNELRDKDRFLWGRSAAIQLREDIARGFAKKLE